MRRAGGDLRTITQTKCTEVTISPNGSWLTWIQTADRDNVLMAAPARDGEPVELLRSPGTLVAVWNTKRDRPIVFDSDSGEVWLIDLDGTKEQIGQVEPGFAGVVCDALEATAAVVRESADGTTLDWVDLPKGTTRVSYQLDATLFDFVLRSDGCLVGRTGKGTILVDLSAQRHRHIEGIRLVPACLRNRHWLAPAPFVSMALRPNALELVAFKPDVLLG